MSTNSTTETIPAPMSDAAMLDTLVKWFDVKYPDDDREVQMDLQRIASRLRAIDGR
jgi:hypothetical protein